MLGIFAISFRYLFVAFPRLRFLLFCAFHILNSSTNWQNFSEKMKIFEFQSIFLSFCVRDNRYPKELLEQLLIEFPRLVFCISLFFPLSISLENQPNISENKEFYGFILWFLSQIFIALVLEKKVSQCYILAALRCAFRF